MQSQATKRGASQPETQHLLAQCQLGDAAAWEALLDRYERLVFAIALREGLTSDEAADVTQATFEAFIDAMPRIRNESSVGAWFACVARRNAWRQRERARREAAAWRREAHQLEPDVFGDMQPQSVSGATTRQGSETFDGLVIGLHEGLATLGEPCRTILTRLYLDPCRPTYVAVAAETGRPVGSIGPTRARCLQRLRRLIDEVDQHEHDA